MSETKIFVYGSMSEGLVHFSKIRDFVVDSAPGFIWGQAYRLKVGYPVLIDNGDDKIPGQVLTVRSPEILMTLLSEFHGCNESNPEQGLHFRKEKRVQTAAGEVSAWVFCLNPLKLPNTATYIEGGDWKSWLAKEPALPQRLSERQKNYIMKLGASSGREIIPIDLPLYRELLNLEIIVDKGRRLALSKLGHEVYRYL